MSIRASDGMEVSEARFGEEINLTSVLRYPEDVRYSKIKIVKSRTESSSTFSCWVLQGMKQASCALVNTNAIPSRQSV